MAQQCIPEHLSERNEKSCLYKNLYMNVYNTFIQNSKTEQNKTKKKPWTQIICLSVSGRLTNWQIHIVEYYSAI